MKYGTSTSKILCFAIMFPIKIAGGIAGISWYTPSSGTNHAGPNRDQRPWESCKMNVDGPSIELRDLELTLW
jgi:hypothetical protein